MFYFSRAKHLRDLALLFCLVVTGCDGIGSGTAPQGLKMLTEQGASSAYVSECSIFNLVAQIDYGDDSAVTGDFSERVMWYSDNPGVATVSNADVAVEGSFGNEFYRKGIVLARAPGATTIRVEYLDFRASIAVEVAPLETLELVPNLSTLAAGTRQAFSLIGKIAGSPEQLDLTEQVSWSLEGNPTNMHLDSDQANLLVVGSENLREGTLVARIPECGYRAQRALNVRQPQQIWLDYQLGDHARLPLGYSELLRVVAQFSDGSEHNLSVQSQIQFEDEETLQIQQIFSSQPGDESLLIQAMQVSPDVGFQIVVPGRESLVLDSKRWLVDELELIAISGQPTQSLQLVYPDLGQLSVLGVFEDGTEIDISRHMTWGLKDVANSSEIDASLIAVGNQLATAGGVVGANLRANFIVQAVPPLASGLDPLFFSVKLYPSYQ